MVILIIFPVENEHICPQDYEQIYQKEKNKLTVFKNSDDYLIYSKVKKHKELLRILKSVEKTLDKESQKDFLLVIKNAQKAKKEIL